MLRIKIGKQKTTTQQNVEFWQTKLKEKRGKKSIQYLWYLTTNLYRVSVDPAYRCAIIADWSVLYFIIVLFLLVVALAAIVWGAICWIKKRRWDSNQFIKAGTIHTRCVLSRPLLDKYERLNENDSDCKFLIDTRTVPLKVVMYEKTNPTSFELFEQQFSSKTLFYCLL